jgi:hypothetical protein
MNTKSLTFAFFILLGLLALQFEPSANAQGLVSLSGKIKYTTDGATLITVPIGNPAQVGTFGQLNVALVYSDTASAGLFSAFMASPLIGDWGQAAPITHKINAPAGALAVTTITVGTNSPEEAFIVGWTGTYTDWNSAWQAYATDIVLLGWSGSSLSGGSLGWSQTNTLPPSSPTSIVSGVGGFAGLVLAPPRLDVYPPLIVQQPQSCAVADGAALYLSVWASGTGPLSYQWRNSSGNIVGATNPTYSLNPAHTNNSDGYFVVVTDLYGATTSAVATVTVYKPVSITTQPASQVVPAGSKVSFSVVAWGFPAPSYQWTFWGTNLPGATSSTLTVTNAQLRNMGDYAVLVGNGYSSQLSDTATLSMSPSATMPYLGATAVWGRSAVLSVGAIGTGDLWYQWYKDGVAIDGATAATLSFANIQLTNGGYYSVVVSSLLGSFTNSALLVVNPANMDLGMYAGIVITGAAGYSYEIQYSTDLRDTNAWVTLTNLTLQQPVELWVDTSVSAFTKAHRYYRILPGP